MGGGKKHCSLRVLCATARPRAELSVPCSCEMALVLSTIASSAAAGVPVPNPRQLDFMSLECAAFFRQRCSGSRLHY